MVIILNLIIPVIILLVFLFTFLFVKSSKTMMCKIKSGIIGLVTMMVIWFGYSAIQPSYMPKGTVRSMGDVPYAEVRPDMTIKNNEYSASTKERRDVRFNKNIKSYTDEVDDILNDKN